MDDFDRMLESIGFNVSTGEFSSHEGERREEEEEVVNTEESSLSAVPSNSESPDTMIPPLPVGAQLRDLEETAYDVANALQDREVHFYLPDSNEIVVPNIEEETSPGLSENDMMDILVENGFEPEVETDLPESVTWELSFADVENVESATTTDFPQEHPGLPEEVPPSEGQAETGGIIEHTSEDEPSDSIDTMAESSSYRLPLNSPTLLVDESTSRFSGAEWYNEIQKQRVIVAGIGGIGSNFCYQLARMAPAALYMYDHDRVEAVNMAGQLFGSHDIGKYKVDAIQNMLSNYTSMQQIFSIRERFTESTEAGDIMVCGFDNMAARKDFFKCWKSHVDSLPEKERGKCLFLDGRLSMTELQVLCIKGDDIWNIERYRKEFLFSDSEAEHTVCSMKQTTYLASMIGSIMVNLFTNFVANTIDPIIPYDLPFFTEYDAQNMIFKTEC